MAIQVFQIQPRDIKIISKNDNPRFFQDLIICFYSFDNLAPNKLGRSYHHYVAPQSTTKNDCLFVLRVWREMAMQGLFEGFTKIHIFSDGGPKHFKMSATMSFFGLLKKHLNVDVYYHFFESNHGHSICDGVAYQAKKVLNSYQRDTGIPINNANEICTVIHNIKNHIADIASISSENKDHPTFHGIRSMMKFTFSPTRLQGFHLSKDEEMKKRCNLFYSSLSSFSKS